MENSEQILTLLRRMQEKLDNIEEEITILREDFEEEFYDEEDDDEGEEYETGELPQEGDSSNALETPAPVTPTTPQSY